MEIYQDIPPLHIEGMSPEAAIREIGIYVETQLSRMQKEIFALRQFLEPAIANNYGAPSQEFNPLE